MHISPYSKHWHLHPNVYIAPKITQPIVIDGDLEKDEWSSVPWSADFDDIRGEDDAPPSSRPSLACRTRFKMLWDEDFLYIGAMIESDMEVRATYHQRNSPIYHEDSDFEVFVDPQSSCHHYKELEMNAINTVWNLMLDKPYADGGQEHSGRIAKPGDDNYYDVNAQKTAVRVVEGSLNEEGVKRTVWTVEIALSHSDTLKYSSLKSRPSKGDRWRINFSRVEEKGEINWTWQRQRVWDPFQLRYVGKVDMHMPDAWGYVFFGPSAEDAKEANIQIGEVPSHDISDGKSGVVDPNWPLILVAMNVYYGQRAYFDQNGHFASEIDELETLDKSILEPFAGLVKLCSKTDSYKVQVKDSSGRSVTVDGKRMTTIASNVMKHSFSANTAVKNKSI